MRTGLRGLSKNAIYAITFTIGLAAACAWIVKIMGPRSTNLDLFCNCSVAEILIAFPACLIFAIECLVFAFRLMGSRGGDRTAGIVAGIAPILLPALAVLVVMFVKFPTIEELHGWAPALS